MDWAAINICCNSETQLQDSIIVIQSTTPNVSSKHFQATSRVEAAQAADQRGVEIVPIDNADLVFWN